MTLQEKRIDFNKKFVDTCFDLGIPYNKVHTKPDSETFWCSVNYYFTQGYKPEHAAKEYMKRKYNEDISKMYLESVEQN